MKKNKNWKWWSKSNR